MYAPQLGRFVSRDPIAYVGSGWNLYTYVKESPTRFMDPHGLVPIVCFCQGRDAGYEKEVDCSGIAQTCCEQACGGPEYVIRWRIGDIWGPNWSLKIGALCGKIADGGNPRCKKCCSCEETFQSLIQAIKGIHVTIPEKCEKWYLAFMSLRSEIQNPANSCYKTGGSHWNKWLLFPDPVFPGHAAIKVEACDGSMFYLDSGFWGGSDNIFAPPEIGGGWGKIKWNPVPDVEETIIW